MKNNSKKKYYRVTKGGSNQFLIDTPQGLELCFARKKIKGNSDILAGDYVYAVKTNNGFILEEVAERKNSLIRPRVANIDQIIIVVAEVPIIDYFLVDKLIINAHRQKLDVVLALNKCDLSSHILDEIKKQYEDVVDHIVAVSALNGDVAALRSVLETKLSAFAGQSAVGKSTLTNALLMNDRQVTGEVSQKNLRGKNTTTVSEIIPINKDSYIVDTPGFSMLDIHDIDYFDFDLYYNEYVSESMNCKYHRCTHTVEPGCAVKSLVEQGKLDLQRYERYVIMFNELKSIKKY